MAARMTPAALAIILATLLAALLFVPFVAREYRRHGRFRAGTAALRFTWLLYGLGLLSYVLTPLPPLVGALTADRLRGIPGQPCALEFRPQTQPLAVFTEYAHGLHNPGLLNLPLTTGVQQFAWNVLLFVPLGLLLSFARAPRHRARRSTRRFAGTWWALFAGFASSLLVECTQLTGLWFLYPCPFRLFDVDDLIANTAGALIGHGLARALPNLGNPVTPAAAQHAQLGPESAPPSSGKPRPAPATRRLLGAACDGALWWWIGSTFALLGERAQRAGVLHLTAGQQAVLEPLALFVAPAGILLLSTVLSQGTSLGQQAVRMRCVSADGSRPMVRASFQRWCVGLGGLACLQTGLSVSSTLLPGLSELRGPTLVAWCAAHAWAISRPAPMRRGIFGSLAGLTMVERSNSAPKEAQCSTMTWRSSVRALVTR